jgi:hypothetical protein
MLTGQSLQPGAEIITNLPGSFSWLAVPDDRDNEEGDQLELLVQLKEDAAPGLYPIRLRTDEGMSNILLFSVGSLPETVEEESLLKQRSERNNNDLRSSAQQLTLPVTVNGTLVGPDQDFYRFTPKAGERLVFEVEARRAGSAIDPVVRVFDSNGSELAVSNDAPGLGVDARVEVTFTQAADHFVLVHDAKYSGQDQNFYRLKIGSYQFAGSIFPLGWQRDHTVEVSLAGGNLPAPVKISPDLKASPGSGFVPVALPGGGSLPFLFRVGNRPELLEPRESSKATPRTAVGAAGKGVTKSQAAKLAADGPTPKFVELPSATVMNGRISQPGEIDRYRVRVKPEEHWAFEVEAASLGTSELLGVLAVYDATTQRRLALTELGQESGTNPFSFESSRNEVDPRISLEIPKEVSEVIVTVEDLVGRGGPRFGYRLTASPQPPDFTVELTTPYVNIPANGTAGVEVVVARRGYDGPIQLSIPGLPADIVQEGGHIPAEMNPAEDRRAFTTGHLTLTAKPDAEVRSMALSVVAESDPSLGPPIRRVAVAPGMIQTIKGTRQKPFKAAWVETSLPAATTKPLPFGLEFSKRKIRLVQGENTEVQWKLKKAGPAAPLVRVDQRPTASIKDLRVLRQTGKPEIGQEGGFNILTTMATPLVTFDLVFDGNRVSGENVERLVTAPAITIELVPGYSLHLLSKKVEIPRGGNMELVGRVEREPGFDGIIKLKAEDLPDHVACAEVTVPVDQTEFRLRFESSAEAKTGEFEVRLTSAATVPERTDKQEFKIPDVIALLVVTPGPVTARVSN